MSPPARQIIAMIAGLVAVAVMAVLLWPQLVTAFQHNPGLNAAILVVFAIGAAYIFWQVTRLNTDIAWIDAFRQGGATPSYAQPRLLAPLSAMLRDQRFSLSAISLRSVLDGIQSRLEESRDISRYFTSLLIFLGLLGTFWGLLGTINGVTDAIRNLQLSGADPSAWFGSLKTSLEQPLGGMGTAFSSSLLGLSGSLILGYLDLQAGQAQNRFFNELEEWLSSQTRLGAASGLAEGEQAVPVYIQVLLERTAESLDQVQQLLSQGESTRHGTDTALQTLNGRLATLVDGMEAENQSLQRLIDTQNEMRLVLARLGELAASGSFGLDTVSRGHIRNLDAQLDRLSEELRGGRTQIMQDIRAEIKLLARTIAIAAGMEQR
ncbi:MAG TPA: flagellar motor protein MotA [Dongiaceae bacterium]|jgi:hypothetical protein|nr:flagellar motor protein MotA [Dongiaceae bacterium]